MYHHYTPKDIVRFFSYIHIPDNLDDCWEWQSSINQKGYGRFAVGGRKYRSTVSAHRAMWEIVYGAINTDLYVLHKCDNPSCCNPTHLFLGTNQQNMDDKVAKGRQSRGVRNPRAKLTPEKAEYIRQRYEQGGISYRKLAEEVGIHHSVIWRVIKRIGW